MAKKSSLGQYRQRRDFKTSPEPKGDTAKSSKQPTFVIQKHDASHMHYDVRLEIDGVLVSWAVPKGPSTDAAIKRLAIRTEDHPLDYGTFEGIIPEGNYGAGTVMVWDYGTYKNIKMKKDAVVPMKDCLKNGQIEVWLEGKKLQGGYVLIETNKEKGQWLLKKMDDDMADARRNPVSTESDSALTGKTMDEIARGEKKGKMVGRSKVGRYVVETTHEERILFPKSKITKGDLIAYYRRIAPIMLPYTKNRPLTMVRYPSGIDHEGFYQKDIPDYFPDWIERIAIPKQADGITTYIVAQNQATLVYIANQGCITPHLWLSNIDKLYYPDMMIFDLDPSDRDPSPGTTFTLVRKAALKLKELLESRGFVPFVKTTGSKGLHVVVPIKRTADFDAVRACAREIAEKLVAQDPKNLTLEVRKEKRGAKVFIDVLRNAFAQTAVAPYAVRPLEHAPVAMPISWDEVQDPKLTSQRYTIKNVFERLDQHGDEWKSMNKYARSIK